MLNFLKKIWVLYRSTYSKHLTFVSFVGKSSQGKLFLLCLVTRRQEKFELVFVAFLPQAMMLRQVGVACGWPSCGHP
jgi:hypothetical protein